MGGHVFTTRDIVGSGASDDGVIGAPDTADLTRGRLNDIVDSIGRALRAAGVGRRDVVASQLPAGPKPATVFLGVSAAAISAPLDPGMPAPELERWLSDVAPAMFLAAVDADPALVEAAHRAGVPVGRVVADGPAAGEIRLELPVGEPSPDRLEPDPDDVALLLHTSGTTAAPKRVPIRHRNLATSASNITNTLRLGPSDRCLGVMPLFHIHGLVASVLASLRAGGSVVCPPAFNGVDIYDWIERSEATWITAVPTMYQAILDRAAVHERLIARCRLRVLRSSSSALPAAIHARLERVFGIPVVESYGMTEAAHQIASNTLDRRVSGSVGSAAGPEIAILDEDGGQVGPGVEGRVVIRGANVVDGYTDPTATAEAFVDGWFITGDVGTIDGSGLLRLTGRAKEMINRGGETIAPAEIDDVLLNHPDVARAMAFAVPDRRLGEQVAALVVAAVGAEPGETDLRRYVAEHLAATKVPRRILVVDDLPRGPTGKPRRIGIAAELGLADLDGPAVERAPLVAPSTPVEEVLHAIWMDVLDRTEIGVQDRFLDSGGDSMLAMRLLARVAETLDLDISIVDFFDRPTVADQARLVEDLLLA
jgi:acyl-CoA synthetase (AMP-forming)/AMP-acid ligase II/acyl carrier protein